MLLPVKVPLQLDKTKAMYNEKTEQKWNLENKLKTPTRLCYKNHVELHVFHDGRVYNT